MVRSMALCLHYVCIMSMTVCDSLRLFVWGQSCRLGHCSSLGSGRARVRWLRAERDDRWHRHLALHGSGSGATPEVHWEGIWHQWTSWPGNSSHSQMCQLCHLPSLETFCIRNFCEFGGMCLLKVDGDVAVSPYWMWNHALLCPPAMTCYDWLTRTEAK